MWSWCDCVYFFNLLKTSTVMVSIKINQRSLISLNVLSESSRHSYIVGVKLTIDRQNDTKMCYVKIKYQFWVIMKNIWDARHLLLWSLSSQFCYNIKSHLPKRYRSAFLLGKILNIMAVFERVSILHTFNFKWQNVCQFFIRKLQPFPAFSKQLFNSMHLRFCKH